MNELHITVRWILLALAVLGVMFGIGILIKDNIDSNHKVAQACVADGRIWINNSCIPPR